MKIIGHKWIPHERFYTVPRPISLEGLKEFIATTQPNSILLFDAIDEGSVEAMGYARTNAIPFALHADQLKSVIFGYALGVKYIIPTHSILKQTQELAKEYLFDALILAPISDESMVEEYALLGIDGVIFGEAIV